MPVTTALIGCGNRGLGLGRQLARSPAFRLLAVCDVDTDRARAAAAELGVRAEGDHRALLAHGDLQSVVIATPARFHTPVALDAIAAGLHVYVEKPLADGPAPASRLAEAAAARGVVGMVGYQNRFTSFASALAREVPPIEPVQGLFSLQRGPLNPQFFFSEHYGGIIDTTTHTVDMMLWCMGGVPEGVVAHVRRGTIAGDRTIEYASLTVDFDGGTRSATVVTSMLGAGVPNVVQVVGRLGAVSASGQRSLSVARHPAIGKPGAGPVAGLEQRTVDCPPAGDPTIQVLEHFAAAAAGEARPEGGDWPRGCTFAEGANAVAVTAAMVRAAEEGRRVSLAEVR